jgi:hypothetical protein
MANPAPNGSFDANILSAASGAIHYVQTIGKDFYASLMHPLLADAEIPLHGFKLEDTFLQSTQDLDSSKIVPLVGGDTATLTNALRFGSITINAVRIANNIVSVNDGLLQGDIILIANYLKSLGDSTGGTLKFQYASLNDSTGGTDSTPSGIYLYKCTVKNVVPIILAGNDVPAYSVQFLYADFSMF